MSATTETSIDVMAAIDIAKSYVAKLFAPDHVKNIGLEEVSSDESANTWNITVGFSRPWDSAPITAGPLQHLNFMFPDDARRTYKIVVVSASDGKVIRVTNRDIG